MRNARIDETKVATAEDKGLAVPRCWVFDNERNLSSNHVNQLAFAMVKMAASGCARTKFEISDIADRLLAIPEMSKLALA